MARGPHYRLQAPTFPLSENDVETACKTLLGTRGWKHERLLAGVFRSMDNRRVIHGAAKGTPDYLVVHPRYPAFYLETKRPGGELSDIQRFKILEIQQGWRLAVAVVASAAELAVWLDHHEAQTVKG